MVLKITEPVRPTPEDLERMLIFRRLPTEAKLRWLDSRRRFMFEIWRRNPETVRNREYLRTL
jgi:hypothetical protein